MVTCYLALIGLTYRVDVVAVQLEQVHGYPEGEEGHLVRHLLQLLNLPDVVPEMLLFADKLLHLLVR